MYKLLIVDDEFLVLEGLKKLVDWGKHQIQIVGEASNGSEGVVLAKSKKPDIILTDIKMPDMSGLDMIKTIKDQIPSMSFIVLSGYDDFNWAKRAIQYGVVDYLLKPLDFQQLDLAIEKAIKNINAERTHEFNKEKLTNELNKSLSMRRRETLLKLLKGSSESENVLKEHLENANLSLGNGECAVMVLKAKNRAEQEDVDDYCLKDIYNKIFIEIEEKGFGYGLDLEENTGVLIFDAQDIAEKWISIMAEFVYEKFSLTRYGIVLGIGSNCHGIQRIKYSLLEAEQAVQYWYLYDLPIIFYSEIKNQLMKLEKMDFPPKFEKSIIEGLKLLNRDIIEQSLNAYYEQISSKKIEILHFKNVIIEFLFGIKRELNKINIDLTKVFIDVFEEIYSIENMNSIESIWNSVKSFIDRIFLFIMKTEKTSSKQVVQEIMQYIEDNYNSAEISLNEVAERIYLTPNYISMLIKQETGENFSDIVVGKRIEKAKELLFDVTLKTYEIAEKVGYSDPNYFSRTFKKVVGISPVDFRNKFCS